MKSAIDNITAAIVRPPRARYNKIDLGPARIRNRGQEYNREDFEVYNDRGILIRGSFWAVTHPDKDQAERCIIYLHPNSGSRIDVVRTRVISIAAQAKCNVCGFDFGGCGDSGGEYVSLGVHEKEDLCAVLVHLLHRGCKRFLLWGRSMGAATATMFYGAYRDLAAVLVVGMVLDSPFTSFQGLALDYSTGKVQIPRLLLSPAIHILRRTVRKRCDFDLFQVNPLAAAPMCKTPTLVLSGDVDKIVSPVLSEELYQSLGGPKIRILFEGGHNSQRPSEVYDAVRELAISVFQNSTVLDTIARTTASLGPKTMSTRVRESKHSDDDLSRRLAPDELTAENDAYQLAAEAEAALKSLLQEKDMTKLTEEDVAAAMSGANAKMEAKTVRHTGGKPMTAQGAPGSGEELSAIKSFVRSAYPLKETHETDGAKRVVKGESKTMRVTSRADDKLSRRVSNHKETSSTRIVHKSKVVVVRSFTSDVGPGPGPASEGDKDKDQDKDLFHDSLSASTGRSNDLDGKAEGKDYTGSPGRGRHSSFYKSLYNHSPLHMSSSNHHHHTSHHHSNVQSKTAIPAPVSSGVSWFNSFLFPAPAPVTAEDKAEKEMCPRVGSSWASLATAMSVHSALDIVCEQTVGILMSIAVGLEERAMTCDLAAMVPEHRAFLLSVLATTAMADLGLPSTSQEDTLSWGRLLGDGMPIPSARALSQRISSDKTSLALDEEIDGVHVDHNVRTHRASQSLTGLYPLHTSHTHAEAASSHRVTRGSAASAQATMLSVFDQKVCVPEAEGRAPTEETELAPPSEENELAPPSEESTLAPDVPEVQKNMSSPGGRSNVSVSSSPSSLNE